MDRLTRTVREQVALGRLLPLGGAGDAAWITESATVGALRRAADRLDGVRLGAVSVALAGTAEDEAASAATADTPSGGTVTAYGGTKTGTDAGVAAVAWTDAGVTAVAWTDAAAAGDAASADGPSGSATPLGALPHLPVRIDAGFEAAVDEPLPRTADRLRAVLWGTADWLGVPVDSVDLAVTGLLDGTRPPDGPVAGVVVEGVVVGSDPVPELGPGEESPAGGVQDRVRVAAVGVPGVLRLTRRLAGLGAGVRVRDGADGRRVQLQIAVAAGHRPLVVARAVGAAVAAVAAADAPGPVGTAVIVTDTA